MKRVFLIVAALALVVLASFRAPAHAFALTFGGQSHNNTTWQAQVIDGYNQNVIQVEGVFADFTAPCPQSGKNPIAANSYTGVSFGSPYSGFRGDNILVTAGISLVYSSSTPVLGSFFGITTASGTYGTTSAGLTFSCGDKILASVAASGGYTNGHPNGFLASLQDITTLGNPVTHTYSGGYAAANSNQETAAFMTYRTSGTSNLSPFTQVNYTRAYAQAYISGTLTQIGLDSHTDIDALHITGSLGSVSDASDSSLSVDSGGSPLFDFSRTWAAYNN